MPTMYGKVEVVPIAELVNSAARVSAVEDFMKRTMMVPQGMWSGLNYMRELRRAMELANTEDINACVKFRTSSSSCFTSCGVGNL